MSETDVRVPESAVKFAQKAKWLGRVTTLAGAAATLMAESLAELGLSVSMALFSLWMSLAMEALAEHVDGIPKSKRLLVPRFFEESFRKHFVYNTESDAKRLRTNVWYLGAASAVACFGITFADGHYMPLFMAAGAVVALVGIRAP